MGKISLFTVACYRDIELCKLQARSISRFARFDEIDSIILVLNERSEDLADAIKLAELLKAYGEAKDLVRLVRADDVLKSEMSRGGWVRQQVLKLRASDITSSSNIVLLDAKNHFVKEFGYDNFFDFGGKPRNSMRIRRSGDFQRAWLIASLEFFGLSEKLANNPAPQTITPYPITRDVLSGTVDFIDEKFGSVESFFDRKKTQDCEFFLIYAHVCH